MNKPTVSIILCTYNGARFIREQLDSIVAQTYPLLEVIIQDDGSTDDTVAICNEYAARFPYIKVRRNEHNLGFNLNFKSAAMRAQGDFVAISDQDDVWMADKIEANQGIAWRPCSLAVLRATRCCSAATSSRPRSTG